ncbi:hypothetical protein [Halorubellus sp. PRR65]|uniref:hypothetical protein n=1 Tax=Halorubellus sp. PRR65 TaxID=3098148 RepID=UPI002B25BC01|nr:hypothetical protein [Halorubellus sp. PRR65]
MDENNHPDIDRKRLQELMKEYATTTSREEEREIESKVLAETVWRIDKDGEVDNWVSFTKAEWRSLIDNVEPLNENAKMRLRQPFIKGL